MKTLLFLSVFAILFSCEPTKQNDQNAETTEEETQDPVEQELYTITPIEHATAVIEFDGKTIYIDPVGGIEKFTDFDKADAVLVTHTHGDHLSVETLMAIKSNETVFIVPQAVHDELPEDLSEKIVVMENGQSGEVIDIAVDAIAMYNMREEAKQFHPKGAGNGYVLHLGEDNVYFSGDTEDTPEMRALTDIDKAFVCMNLPYTMSVETAAEAVLAFQPNQVYPYHYRGKGGISDVGEFKRLVEEGSENIEVIQWNWYPDGE